MKRLEEIKELLADSSFADYRTVTPAAYTAATEVARKMKGLSIVHVNATAACGGVAELLKSQVAYERELGLSSHWLVVKAPQSFFKITKKIHNLLQGRSGGLAAREFVEYLSLERQAKRSLLGFLRGLGSGIVVLHDPQTLPLVWIIPSRFVPIARLHVDLSSPNPVMLDALKPMLKRFREVVVSNKAYTAGIPWIPKERIAVLYPAIDHFSEKNRSMNLDTAQSIMEKFGLDPAHPIVAQVSRFDLWKDPLGVVDAYRIARKKIPDLQLILAGLIVATDDAEANGVFAEVKQYANHDKNIFLFGEPSKLKGVSSDSFVNAVYTASTVMVQKSVREGFGLTMTEAMGKGKAIVAGKTSGSLIQVKSGRNGIIADSTEVMAEEIVRLVKNKALCRRLGAAAAVSVKKRFFMSRFLLDNLRLYESLKK